MPITRQPAWVAVWMCAASLACSPTAKAAQAAKASCHTRTAVEGDTLIGLSQRYLAQPARWQALARVNQVANPRRIPVGTTLCIPTDLMKGIPRQGTVLEVVGEATRQAPTTAGTIAAPPQPLRQGDAVTAGMTLRTSADGYVTVQLADGSILKVRADTEARLDSSQQYEEAGFYATIWSVLRGRIESLVTHLTGGQPRYQIKTPQAVLGVRGTEFRVATDVQRTWGETLKGSVEIRSGAKAALVSAGQGTVTRGPQGLMPPMALPSPPSLDGVPGLFERPLIRLALPVTAGAQAYRVQVAEDADFRRIRAEVTSVEPRFRIADLPDGAYHLRVRVANAEGLEGLDATTAFVLKARPEPPIPTAPANRAKLRAREATLSWTAHPQATHYRLQIARDVAFSQIVHEQPDLRDTQFTLALPPGDYHWRIATTAGGQDRGPWGDAQTLLMREPPAQPPPPRITADALAFQLQAEPGQRFEFQMASDAGFTVLLHELASAQPEVTLPRPAEGGRLYVRYRAIDPDGFIGPYTAPQLVALPACVRSGAWQCIHSGDRFLTTQP